MVTCPNLLSLCLHVGSEEKQDVLRRVIFLRADWWYLQMEANDPQ